MRDAHHVRQDPLPAVLDSRLEPDAALADCPREQRADLFPTRRRRNPPRLEPGVEVMNQIDGRSPRAPKVLTIISLAHAELLSEKVP